MGNSRLVYSTESGRICLYVASTPNLLKMFQYSSRPQEVQIRYKNNTL